MLQSKCYLPNCDWVQSDLPHIDACMEELRAHYRAVHPTKYLPPAGDQDVGYQLQDWNKGVDDFLRDITTEDGQVHWRNLMRYFVGPDAVYYSRRHRPENLAELRVQYEANYIAPPQPAPGDVLQDAGFDDGVLVDEVFDGPEIADDIPFNVGAPLFNAPQAIQVAQDLRREVRPRPLPRARFRPLGR